MHLKTAGVGVLITLLLALVYVLQRAGEPVSPIAGNRRTGGPAESQRPGRPDSPEHAELENLLTGRKASVGQIKPGFSEFPAQPVSAGTPFSRDAHNLPAEYFTPQSPDAIRKAMDTIKAFQEANPERDEVRNTIPPAISVKERTGQ